ncbi:MAG: glycosyltransferase family 8 protein [Bacteroidales bacterium]|nr:glycosyltransferase family 8 protein [Bacteroidales bacterium]
MTPLAIAFTPNYFVPAATMLKSLLDSSSDADSYRVICLVTDDIPDRMKDKLARMGAGRLEFEYINLAGRLKDVYTDPRYTEAASFRLLLPEILPEYKSIVYIDCDVIVRQDIAGLYANLDLKDNYLGVVYEAPIENQAERFKALGCNPREYFNSGFLVMNLEQMRKDRLTEKLLDACKVDYLEFPDQDALNQVCKGRVIALSPVYNGIRTFFLPQYKKDFVSQYSETLWKEVQKSGTIHYTGGKPWNLFTVKFGQWWKTYDSLPAEIKEEWTPVGRAPKIWRLYRIRPVQMVVDAGLNILRSIR